MKKITDYYGTELVPGVAVAFNFAGEVRLGKLLSVTPVKRYGKTHNFGGELFLKLEVLHQDKSGTSTVTNRRNLVVLPESQTKTTT